MARMNLLAFFLAAEFLASGMEAGATLLEMPGRPSDRRKVVSRGARQAAFVGTGKDVHVPLVLQFVGMPILTLTITKARAQRTQGF